MSSLMQEANKLLSKLTVKQTILLFLAIVVVGTFISDMRKRHKRLKLERQYREEDAAFEEKVIRGFQKEFHMTPLHNLLLPLKNGNTVVDLAFVSDKGIFCIECKCWGEERDCVYPNWDQTLWSFEKGNKKKNCHYPNPFKQNSFHIRMIKNALMSFNPYLAKKTPVYNIVFVQNIVRYKASGVIDTGNTTYVSSLQDLGACIVSTNSIDLEKMPNSTKGIIRFMKEHDRLPTALTRDQVFQIGEYLKSYVENSPGLQEQLEDIKREEEKM